jgi:hypothetical protein
MFLKINDHIFIPFNQIRQISIHLNEYDHNKFQIRIFLLGEETPTMYRQFETMDDAKEKLENLINYIELKGH